MKNRSDVLKERPEGRYQENRKSRSQLKREAIQSSEGRREVRLPRPGPDELTCLYCGSTFRSNGKPIACPSCATPL